MIHLGVSAEKKFTEKIERVSRKSQTAGSLSASVAEEAIAELKSAEKTFYRSYVKTGCLIADEGMTKAGVAIRRLEKLLKQNSGIDEK